MPCALTVDNFLIVVAMPEGFQCRRSLFWKLNTYFGLSPWSG